MKTRVKHISEMYQAATAAARVVPFVVVELMTISRTISDTQEGWWMPNIIGNGQVAVLLGTAFLS